MDNPQGGDDPVRPASPNEIVLLIVDRGPLDRHSRRSSALASSRLFHITRHRYYQGCVYTASRYADEHVGSEAVEQCAEFNAAPVDFE
ncbi:hypothetical protein G7Z17_g8664 [Cylindrodendrum hubeiense]|uniref:Uncharacterized protein n=1 Tax=Cylindrodendrum hubeiense TaxID=595255 RepID=A0A9P5H0T6_9HYPO|nr:hypothetical protein G7Z17_g8664 [Cylindrodendrum hubeiense]